MDNNNFNNILREFIVLKLCDYFECRRDTFLYIKHENNDGYSWSQITPETMAYVITNHL